jgi:alkylresorcinol/alkylpyrone synthase
VRVEGRYLALPLEHYERLESFRESNDAYIAQALDVGQRAVQDALRVAGLAPEGIDHIFFVSVTGIATPSIDARLVNRLGLRLTIKRTPMFGLGCVAGVSGIARAADYLRAFPEQRALLLSVELCSLTMQRGDQSVANIISSGLFGDGAAAVLLGGDAARAAGDPIGAQAASRGRRVGPKVIATKSVFYPDTERVMGWDIGDEGFRVVLSAAVPDVVKNHIRRDVDGFLAEQGLTRRDIASYVCHPGGPKVLQALEEALELREGQLAVTWNSLRQIGNLSSASVLMVLADTMADHRPPEGSLGLMLAMGPGFCSELVLLRW